MALTVDRLCFVNMKPQQVIFMCICECAHACSRFGLVHAVLEYVYYGVLWRKVVYLKIDLGCFASQDTL